MIQNNNYARPFEEQEGPAVHLPNTLFKRSDPVIFNCFQAQNLSRAIQATWNSVPPEGQNRLLRGAQDRLADLRAVVTQVPEDWRGGLQDNLVDLTATLSTIKEKQDNPAIFQTIETVLCTTNTIARFNQPSSLEERVNILLGYSNSAIDKSIENLSFSDVEQLKNDAAYAQQLLSRLNSDHPIKTKLEQIIRQYENFVNTHAVLRDLEALEQFLKSPTSDGWIWERFQQLVTGTEGVGASPDPLLIDDVRGKQIRWQEIRKKIWDAAKEIDPFLLSEKTITWVTGSRSSAILMIEQVSRTALARKPALVPTEQLLMHNIVPLSGEMSFGIEQGSINTYALSGMPFTEIHRCLRYAHEESFLFNAQTEVDFITETTPPSVKRQINRLRAAVLRLVLMNQKPELWPRLKNHILSLVEPVALVSKPTCKNEDWPLLSRLIGLPVPSHMVGTALHPEHILIKGDIIGIPRSDGVTKLAMVLTPRDSVNGTNANLLINKDAAARGAVGVEPTEQARLYKDEELALLANDQPNLSVTEMTKASALMNSLTEKLTEIPTLFDTVQPLDLSKEQLSLIENSFPILWASCTASPRDSAAESLVSKTMELGDDIQFVFTNEEHVERLNRSLNRYGVKAFSFEAAHYLKARMM